MPHTHQPIHRPILQQAWATTWSHKRLWLLGVLTGVINTGSILDIIFRSFHRLSPHLNLKTIITDSLPWASTVLLYVQKLRLTDPTRLGLTVTVILLSLFILGLLALCAQATLIKAIPLVDRGRKLPALTSHPLAIIGRLLTLAITVRLTMIALSLVVGALMSVLSPHTFAGDSLVNTGLLLLFVPAALLTSYLSIFAAIEICARGKGVVAAVVDAFTVLKKHWLPLSELAVVLFFINLLISTAVLGSILVFAVPYLLTLRLATIASSNFLWLGTITGGAIILALFCLTVFGFMTTFLYAAWYHAYTKFGRQSLVVSKLERLIHAFL